MPTILGNAAPLLVSAADSLLRLSCTFRNTKEIAMSMDTKTPLEHLNDVLAQLKEMRHYAKNNVESLTTQWLLFDGELKKLKQAGSIETLMTRQGELHDAINDEIGVLEGLAAELRPAPEEVTETAKAS